ncbi:MAG: hypothetical protein ACJ74Z_01995 [Bryobacteraceae bacterium]
MEESPSPAPSLATPKPAVSPAALYREFVFYGASRMEAPRIGSKFRRTGTTFQVLGVRPERTRSREFARSWKFTAECQLIPLWEY